MFARSMTGKLIFAVCASIFVQNISGQYFGGFNDYDGYGLGLFGFGRGYNSLGYGGFPLGGYGCGCCDYGGFGGYGSFGGFGSGYEPGFGGFCPGFESYGGGLQVMSASPIAPTGLIVKSENAIEGALAVIGNLPFLGAVVTDGAFPSCGVGAISYGCGDGVIGITAEGLLAPIVPVDIGYVIGYDTGCGCECGGVY